MADLAEYAATLKGTQTAVEFRYAEVLLMLAEAKAELGTISQGDIDATINALRERAGFDFATYPNSKLTIGNEPNDPRLDAIYADKLGYSLSPLLREIRRERRVEMVWEGLRYVDLMRWKAGKLMTVPMRGMKMTAEKQTLYATAHSISSAGYYNVAAVKDKEYYLDADGFIIAYRNTPGLDGTGTLPWSDKRYYWPIPKQEIELNPNLKQSSYDGQAWE
jgi:hypothetical protein